ncbi:MAG: AAA family ATPase, partial [Clostridia bacterium]|nr:AAA family ATPase [Clostridia bacterium]
MYLKSIELQGFKSFPDRTKLVFDNGMVGEQAGVTVIVGPNGSGKSNIADAMRWVLGEISSKSLRGTKMEDVIFGGADSRRPMGYAEVSVTFDNTGEFAKLDCPYDEVTVTRRYYRSGESEYYINRRAVRLRDIYELFMNTGIGRDGYSIIGQGRIAEMVSRKSDERRSTFEDASGIAKFRHKKNEAERKLAKAEENMVRIMDVFTEVQSQVGPLEKEAGKAKRAIELMDSKKRADVSLWLYDTERFRNEIGVAEDALRHSSFDLQNAEDSLQAMEMQNNRLFEASQTNKMASEQLLTQIREQTQENHTLDSEFRVTESNIAHTKELIEAANSSMALSQKNMEQEQVSCGEHSARIVSLTEQTRALEKEQEGIAGEIRTTRAKIAVLEADIATALADIRQAEADATDIRVRISVLENARNSGSDRNEDILADMETYERACEALRKQSADKQKTVSDYQNAIVEATAEIESYNKRLTVLNAEYGELTEQISTTRLRRDSAQQRIQTFKHMEENFEGYANSVKYVMSRYAEGRITVPGGQVCGKIYGPLSKVVSVDEKYVTAIETALGANLQHIVVDDEETAKAAMYALKKGEAGRATFFPLTS